ncbi:MAG: ABC transporter substrate-binding protein [Deltaproteobacteria bacterium]|nr:ABC transporter substrate-binding protein [Deltaproteobacteria bacterium]
MLSKFVLAAGFFLLVSASLNAAVYRRYLPDRVITLDPLKTVERYSQFVALQIYDPLFHLKDGTTPVPHLAESYTYNSSTKSFRIQIRKDVFFHDGLQLKAADILFSIQRMCRHNSGNAKVLPLIKGCRDGEKFGIQETGDFELSIQLHEHFPPFISYLASPQFMILPNSFHGRKEEEFFKRPVGTGAFILEHINNDEVSLKRNDRYFLGKSDLDGIVGLTEPQEKIYARLKDGSIDDIFPLPPPATYPSAYEEVRFNTASSMLLTFRTGVEPFERAGIRKALRASIRFDRLKTEYSSQGIVPGTGVVPWGAIGFDPAMPIFQHDRNIVRQYLREAGYADVSLVPKIVVHVALKEPLSRKIAELIESDFREQGFKCLFAYHSLPELVQAIQQNKAGVILFAPAISSIDTYQFMEMWRSGSGSGLSPSDKEYDAVLDSALKSSDRVVRGEIYKKADRLLVENAYTITLGHIISQRSLRKKGWTVPIVNILGPFLNPMYGTRLAGLKG